MNRRGRYNTGLVVSLATLAPLWSAAGCSTEQTIVKPDLSWQRMLDQPRYDPYEPSSFFQDGLAMRVPPTGTVSRDQFLGSALLLQGIEAGRYSNRVPVQITHSLLATGRDHFETVCANCHGVLGDGISPVAANMQLRKPPSLHEERIRAYPPGRIFQVITDGYGLMPSHKAYLTPQQRWAVVAYVHALQLSQHAPVAALPERVRQDLLRAAP